MANGRGGDGRYTEQAFADVGAAVGHLSAAMEGYRDLQVDITGLSIRGPRVRGDEFLMVVRGVDHEGLPLVAFHSAMSLGEVLRGGEARIANGTLKWKPDEFANK